MKFEGRDCFVSPKATLGMNVRIGDRAVIYDNVILEDGVTIANDCIIGEPQGRFYEDESYENPPTRIGAGSLIRSHAIVYSGVNLGSGFSSGHRVTIREGVKTGVHCRVGTLCDLQGNLSMGSHVWLHSNVHLGQGSVLEDFVFIYPYVVLTNDPLPPSEYLKGVTVRKYTQIGTMSVVMPGIEIGASSLVGAGAVVTKDVEEFSCVVGNPAKRVKDVRDMKMPDGTPAYPWPHRFDRGMPWAGMGYDAWSKSQIS